MINCITDFYWRVRKILKWIPVLWNNYEWDYVYMLELLKFKLKCMREYHYESRIVSDWKEICDQIEQAERCLDRLIKGVNGDSEYLIQALEELQPNENINAKERALFENDFNTFCDILRKHMRCWWE